MKLSPTPLAFRKRILWLRALAFIGFAVLMVGYARIQIQDQERYTALGEKYRVKKRRIKATRGLIYDREMRLITQNMPSYNLTLMRDEMEEPWRTLKPKIAQFLDVSEERLDARYQKRSHLLSQPVPLKEDISFQDSLRILRGQRRFPGLSIETAEKRYYAYGDLFTHALGYVGEASQEALQRNKRLRPGDIVGKTGVELHYDHLLTGKDGERTIKIDRRGVYRANLVTEPPSPGKDLVLTLDLDLQELARRELGPRNGSIVMMDVRTGEILAYVSTPTYNLNLFTGSISQEEWQALLRSSGNPFLSRPIQGVYAPGSVFKLVTGLAALRHGKANFETRYFCTGEMPYLNHVFHCHNEYGHGWVNMEQAIKTSCNVYFWNLAHELEANELASVASELGFGQKTGVDLTGEKQGRVPTPEWKKRRLNQYWYPGDTLNLSIGQGDLLATPIQVVTFMATMATEGRLPQPRLLLKSGHKDAYQHPKPEIRRVEGIAKEHFSRLKKAMWRVVNEADGTGHEALVPGFDVCGKTGTAQLITFTSEEQHKVDANKNAWFAGFAPRNKAEVAFIVLVEQGGAGGSSAAPIVKKLLEAYQSKRQKVDPS